MLMLVPIDHFLKFVEKKCFEFVVRIDEHSVASVKFHFEKLARILIDENTSG